MRLSAQAGKRSLSDYIRERLFGGENRERREKPLASGVRDLAHILANLNSGQACGRLPARQGLERCRSPPNWRKQFGQRVLPPSNCGQT